MSYRKHILTTLAVHTVLLILLCASASTLGRAQDGNEQGAGSSGAAPAATGLDTTAQQSENPPLSGLDEPSFEPKFVARSYLVPKVQVSESVDSNGSGGSSSNHPISTATRGLGSVMLQKLWKTHPLDLDYVGGVDWYHTQTAKTYQLHSGDADQSFLWRTGKLSLRDSFTYLPEGTFGANSFGGVGGFAGGLPTGGIGGGGSAAFGNGQFGSLGFQPRITNMSIVDITQYLSPRNSLVLAGGYGWTDFLNNPQGYTNSQMTVGDLGFSRLLSKQDQLAVQYSYQQFHFPRTGSGTFNAHDWQAVYGHRISGKLDFRVGGGPQWLRLNQCETQAPVFVGNVLTGFTQVPCSSTPSGFPVTTVTRSYWTWSAQAAMNYRASARSSMQLNYSHGINPGSGIFSGAETDSVRFSFNHSLTRRWSALTDVGYSRSSQVLSGSSSLTSGAHSYSYWYTGGALRYQLGKQWGAFASYQYDDFQFGSSFQCSGPSCSRGYGRHVGLIGLDWTPRPIRLD